MKKHFFIVLFIVAIRVDVFSQNITGKWKETVNLSKMYFTIYTFAPDGLFVRVTDKYNHDWDRNVFQSQNTNGMYQIQNDTIFLSINKIQTFFKFENENGDMCDSIAVGTYFNKPECYIFKINTLIKNLDKPSVFINGQEYMKIEKE